MWKYVNSLTAVIGIEILGVILMMVGLLPREAALFLLGIFAFFVIFAPLKQAALFAVFSIPLYTALPISESFDSMAAWRIIVAILFIRILVVKMSGSDPAVAGSDPQKLIVGILKTRLGVLVGLFFALGTLSLVVAQEPIAGIKKLLFLANIFALFFVIREVVKNKQDFVDVLRFTFAGSVLALAVAYAQFIAILFVPLYTFWQWWASHVIPVFYGANLGALLSYSNTWFSYYEEAEPTLRVFSTFPDSHSFALAMVLALPMALTFFFAAKLKMPGSDPAVAGSDPQKSAVLGGIIIFILLAIIFSGTRGVWIGAIPVLGMLFIAYLVLNYHPLTPSRLVFALAQPRLAVEARRAKRAFLRRGNRSPAFLKTPPLLTKERGVGGEVLGVVKTGLIVFFIFALLFPISSQLLKFSQIRQGGIVSGTTFERISTSFSARELSNLGRIQIWKSTFSSIAKNPFLGVGIGNYPVVLNENVSAVKEGASAHSLYLDVASEMGVLGGLLLLLIFLEILWRAIQVFRKNQDPFLAAFAGFFAVYFLWVMAYSVVDVVLLNDKVLLLFVTLVGLLYARLNHNSSEK